MPLGLPSRIKYINVSRRPKRYFVKRADGALEEIFCIHLVHPDRRIAEALSMRWHQDTRSDVHASS